MRAPQRFSPETYHALFESAPDAVIVVDAGRIIAANPQAERLFGYRLDELLGEPIEKLVPERFHGVHPAHRKAYAADPAPRPMGSGLELLGRHKSGAEFPVEISLSPLRQGDRMLVSAAVRDVTERKRAQDELRRIRDGLEDRVRERTAELNAQIAERERAASQLRQQAEMLDLVSEPIFAWDMDKDNGVVFWNKAATETYGYRREETLGRNTHELLQTEHPQGIAHVHRLLMQGGHWSGELQHTTRDGQRITVESRMSLFPSPSGERLVLESCRDITARRAAEETLRQAQKMEAVGQLTGGIAHDFNNLLTIILANLQLLDGELPADSLPKELVESATRAAHRGADLTRKLLIFARRQRLEASSLDVNELILSMTRMLTRALGEHIRIGEALSPGLPDVFADAAQLETVLLNLVINARDAMPQGGQLTIATAEADVDETTPDVRLPTGPYVVVKVSDTGIGMSPEVAARAFEPFFTTKEAGKGTGLGLSMVYGFAKQSGGHVQLESQPGQGTTVTLYLPEAKGTEAASELSADAQPTGSEGILLVEDDDEVRAATSRMLSGLGYRVVEVADAETALTLLTPRSALRLLLTDVVLARGMSGPELAAKARQVRPGLKVLFMSGYVRDTVAFHEQLDRDAHFLAKPFTKEELATTVRLALDEGSG